MQLNPYSPVTRNNNIVVVYKVGESLIRRRLATRVEGWGESLGGKWKRKVMSALSDTQRGMRHGNVYPVSVTEVLILL